MSVSRGDMACCVLMLCAALDVERCSAVGVLTGWFSNTKFENTPSYNSSYCLRAKTVFMNEIDPLQTHTSRRKSQARRQASSQPRRNLSQALPRCAIRTRKRVHAGASRLFQQ
jgi:hypothetical protein